MHTRLNPVVGFVNAQAWQEVSGDWWQVPDAIPLLSGCPTQSEKGQDSTEQDAAALQVLEWVAPHLSADCRLHAPFLGFLSITT